jgi:hypothetical protein
VLLLNEIHYECFDLIQKSDKKKMMPVDILEWSTTLRENDMVTRKSNISDINFYILPFSIHDTKYSEIYVT